MSIFKCAPEDLAKLLVNNSKMYNAGVSFLNFVKNRHILNPDLESKLEADIQLLKDAQTIATKGEYFAFYVYDSWADNHHENSEGIELYQRIGSELIRRLEVDCNGVPREDRAIEILKAKRVKRVFTLTPDASKGYCGIEYESIDGEDGEVIQRKALEEHQICFFEEAKIKVIMLEE